MSQRMSRTHKRRATFRIDSLLAEKMKRTKKPDCSCFGNNMTIMFQGYFDRFQSNNTTTATTNNTAPAIITNNNNNNNNHLANKPTAKVRVEVLLLKIAQKKRRENPATTIKQIGVVEIPQNPPEHLWEANDLKFPAISLGADLLDPADGPCTQIVAFRTQPVKETMTTTMDHHQMPGGCSAELMLFDKLGRCLLTEGEYQLSLQEALPSPALQLVSSSTGSSNGGLNGSTAAPIIANDPKTASWENLSVFHSDSSGFEDQFDKNPIIKFQLHWTDAPYCGDYQRIVEVKQEPTGDIQMNGNSSEGEGEEEDEETSKGETKIKTMKKRKKTEKGNDERNVEKILAAHEIFGGPSADLRIAFHFVHNSVSHQTTEQTNSRDCPWCSLGCLSLYSLLKHLKLCHARFAFNFVHTGGNAARIEVSINDLFDGSYAGAPNNYLTTPSAGYAFSRSGPVRRTTVTHVQVCRPRRSKPSLAEFTETDEALEMNGTAGCGAGGIDRPYLSGHNRLYHHTMTCLPVHPRELDVDSEEESDPRWLKQKTMMMIDEFTDVNEGEKELMKMWNLHVMRHGFVGDCQTALACEMFVEQHGREVLAKNLYRNFVVHLCSLYDYGLVSSEAFHKVVQRLQRCLNESVDAKGVIYEARAQHREHWNVEGYVKFEEQQREQQQEQLQRESEEKRGGGGGKKAQRVSKEGAAKGPQPAAAAAQQATTRSRELFQKPKGAPPLESGTSSSNSSSSSNKKKTGTGAAAAGGAGQKQSGAAENPNKRKLERGENRVFILLTFRSMLLFCFFQNHRLLGGVVQT